MCTLIGLGLLSASAQTNSVAAVTETSMSIQEIIETGGWLMYVLAVMSLVGLAFVVYFIIALRRPRILPPEFLHDLHRLVSEQNLDQAMTLCQNRPSPASAIAQTALRYAQEAEDVDPVLLKEIMEGEGSRQASAMQGQIKYLEDIAIIAPMVGLLGTVIGMLSTFNVVALDIAKAKPMLLAGGVSQALITTAAGLIVGIPAMVFYAYFRGRTSRLLSDMEVMASDLLGLLTRRPKTDAS